MKYKMKKWLSSLGIIFICFITLIFLPTPASSEEIYKFERMWPTLQQPWYFSYPYGITVDNLGNVYVADTHKHRIQKFTSNGQFIGKWGTEGDGKGAFNNPCGIALDNSGNVYVADTDNHRIQKFTSEGQFVAKWGNAGLGDGEFNEPFGIAVDNIGNVYVTDSLNCRIQKFTSDGQFVTKWGSYGTGDGEFNEPFGIAVDSNGNIYVADLFNHRIQKFTADGQFIGKWESKGSEDGEFDFPSGITVDTSSFVYVAERGNDRIQKFTTEGQFVAKWGSAGLGDGEFNDPFGIAVDNIGNVYVADMKNHRIQKFTSEGQFVAKWGVLSSGSKNEEFDNPYNLSIDTNNFVYVADTGNHRIQKFTSDGQFVAKWGSYGTEEGNFNWPYGIAADTNNFVYVVDEGNHRIQKFTSDGQFVAKWGSKGSEDGEFEGPHDVAVDNLGNVYVVEEVNNRIQKFTSEGQFVAKWGTEGDGNIEFYYPWGIAVDSSNFVYVADTGYPRIQKFTSEGQSVAKFGEFGSSPSQFFRPVGLCIGKNGRVYVSDFLSNRIQAFNKVTADNHNRAIIIAGSGAFEENTIWNVTQMCANYAYRALTYQGYTKDTIYYLSSDMDLDLDGNGILDDVDANATNSSLQYAITTWAKDTEDLFIYMVGHGGEGTFRMSELEFLKAKDIDTWLDTIQGVIPGNVTLLYDACRSGSFLSILDPPSGKERIIATSASKDEEAIFVSQGTISFSFLFWAKMFNGDSFYDSFYHATQSIGVTYPQNPLLEGNGNGIGNEREDMDIVRDLKIGNETRSAGDIPVIGSVSPTQTLDGETSALIYAENVIDADGISRIWAIITPPDYTPNSPDNPVTDLPILDLTSTGNNRYEGTYNNFTSEGTYTIAIFASDSKGVLSMPKATTVTVSDGYAYGDVAPLGNRDGTVNVGDALVALRFALNLETPTQEDIEHGDVAPLDAQGQPNPDGVINVGDALVILRKALGIIRF